MFTYAKRIKWCIIEWNCQAGSDMTVEIELKARLDDVMPVKERLSAVGDYYRSYNKLDTYWFSVHTAIPVVRIRREHGLDKNGAAFESVLVTYKAKEITGGIEISDEHEFSVSDAAIFEDMLSKLDLHKAIQKEKSGWAWTVTPEEAGLPFILAELSLVKTLGWFLELEILTASNDNQTVKDCRKRLLLLLEKLEIPMQRIEDRPYTTLLAER